MRFPLGARPRPDRRSVAASALPLLSAALVVSAGCGTGDPPPPTSLTAQLGTEFTAVVGSTAHLDDDRLMVLVRQVSDDSRCPQDVECVWPGDATVALQVTVGDSPSEHALHTYGTDRNATEVSVDGYRIQLRGLTPGGRTGDTPQEDYRVRVLTTRDVPGSVR